MLNISIFSPLEQFDILPLYVLHFGPLDLTLTNQTGLIFIISIFLIIFFFSSVHSKDSSLFVVPTRYQSIVEIFYILILSMVLDNVNGKKSQFFFPLIFCLFFLIASMNLIGLVPFSFTVSSHFVATFVLSFSIFWGINILCFQKYKMEIFSLFLPAGTPLLLAFLLVPVEFVLYLFRPLSLAIRLFCNMMAGHTLLKIFAGFAWSLLSFTGVLFFLHFVPLLTLVPLFALELGVALVQAFVFSLLVCIYLNDGLNLH